MQDKTELIRSPASLNYQLVFFTISFVILAFVSIFILIVPFTVFDRNVLVWLLVFTCIAIAFYTLSIWMLNKTWHSNRYYLAQDCLIVSSGFSSRREDVYRYESIASVSMQQNGSEKTRGYARLVLAINGADQPIVLKDIIHPQQILETLQNNIVTASRTSNS